MRCEFVDLINGKDMKSKRGTKRAYAKLLSKSDAIRAIYRQVYGYARQLRGVMMQIDC